MRRRKILALLLCLAMVAGLLPMGALADESASGGSDVEGKYVLMNIPYDKFYENEGIKNVDAVSSATVKTYNQTMAAGSYHSGYSAPEDIKKAKILGVTYPVYVSDMSMLAGKTSITDSSSATISVAAGKSGLTTKEVTGQDLLFASGDYAYYVMSSAPTAYKTLTVGNDGVFTFSKTKAIATASTATVTPTYTDHHVDVALNVETSDITDTSVVTGVILTAGTGNNKEQYALRHVENIWRKTSLGWSWSGLDGNGLQGKTITNLTYYLQDGSIYSYDVTVPIKRHYTGTATAAFGENGMSVSVNSLPTDIQNPKLTLSYSINRQSVVLENSEGETNSATATISMPSPAIIGRKHTVTVVSDNYADIVISNVTYNSSVPQTGFVLMNIPYDKFYENEGIKNVDAVSSATVKTYNQTMAAGSYHSGYSAPENIKEAKILGVTYPVYVSDMSKLADKIQITGSSSATISVAAGKSDLTTKEVTGLDVLFASGDYAYYVMSSDPTAYKTLTVGNDGVFTFSKTNAEVTASTATVTPTYTDHHVDVALNVETSDITDTSVVTGVILTAGTGNSKEQYALRHVENIWRKTSLGWSWSGLDGSGLQGKTITNLTYYLQDGLVYSYNVEIPIKLHAENVTAVFTSSTAVTVNGLPDGIEKPVATVQTKVGRGETPVKIADNVEVIDGKLVTTTPATSGQEYTVLVTSDNYADLTATATYTAPSGSSGGGTTTNPVTLLAASDTDNATVTSNVSTAKAGDTVTVTVKPDEGYKVDQVKVTDKNGKEVPVTDNGDGTYSFKMPATGVNVKPVIIEDEDVPLSGGKFVDVSKDAYYAPAVDWAVDKSITTGKDATHFAPNDTCTRAQMVTFLWRAAGQPEPTVSSNPFTDVPADAYYAKAVLWAVEKGITTGVSDTSFNPNGTVNRAQSVTFLYRFSGEKTNGTNPFTDVSEGAYCYDAVLWAADKNVTTGKTATTFAPSDDCVRGQIVTFLYRAMGQA